jgi:hypothetical protein
MDGYDASDKLTWNSNFTNQANGSPALFFTRTVDMTKNGNFVPNDQVIIRFRLFANETTNGWGWAVDNLYIQDAITSTEKELESAITVYPNPAKENITVEAAGLSSPYFTIQLMSMQGQTIYAASAEAVNGKMSHTIAANNLTPGLYIVKITNEGTTVLRKVMKKE